MPAAPTPAPHTPVNYLKAGGNKSFSAKCQKALIESALVPAWFGDYNHVVALNSKAREKCKRWDKASEAARRAKTHKGKPLERPTRQDRHLAKCQAGHLARDSNFRASGTGARGNPCANVVPGWRADRAPCVPMTGTANEKGEHGLVTRMEEEQAQDRADANPPESKTGKVAKGGPYRHGDRRSDEDARTEAFLRFHVKKYPGAAKGVLPGGVRGAGTSTTARSGSAAGGVSKLEKGNVRDVEDQQGDRRDPLKVAAECINAWRRKIERQMFRQSAIERDNLREETAPKNGYSRQEWATELEKTAEEKQAAAHRLPKGPAKTRAESDAKGARQVAKRYRSNLCKYEQAQELAKDWSAHKKDGHAN